VTRVRALAAALLLLAPCAARGLDAEEVKARWMNRLDGRSFSAEVTLRVRHRDLHEERRVEVWRDDQLGRERLMARFESPAEIRGLGLLYLEREGAPNDYFVYQPATRRVRRVPEVMAREDVYGVDLEYLGFGVAQIEPTRVESVAETVLADRPALRLEESALRADARFDRRIVWLDAASFVPVRTEHVRDGHTTLVAVTDELATIQGVVTPRRVRFERPDERQIVEMQIDEVDYVAAIPEAFFTTLRLLQRR
jgi:hypothetical protein